MPRVIWGPGWLESLSLLLGALILSDHGNTIWSAQYSIFLQMVFYHCLCFHVIFMVCFFFAFVGFLLCWQTPFFRFSRWIWFPFNPEEYFRFTFFLLTSWSNKGARIDSVRFIRELFSPTFFLSTVMVYKTAASGLAKPASYPNMAVIYVSYICYITDTHIRIINRLAV